MHTERTLKTLPSRRRSRLWPLVALAGLLMLAPLAPSAAAQDGLVREAAGLSVISHDAGEPAPVALSWQEAPLETSRTDLAFSEATLLLTNRSGEELLVEVELNSDKGGELQRRRLGLLRLGGGASETVTVALDDLAEGAARGATEFVTAHAFLSTADGSPRGQSSSPVLYLAAEAHGGLVAFGEEVLRQRELERAGAETLPEGVTLEMGFESLEQTRDVNEDFAAHDAALGDVPAAPQGLEVEAAGQTYYLHTFCAQTRVTTVDSGVGEDYGTTPGAIVHPARFAQMKVTRGGATVLPTTYANSGGCVYFYSPYITGFKLEMWSRARIPRTDNAGHNNILDVQFSNGTNAYWYWNLNSNPYSAPVFVQTNQTRRSNLLGISSWALQQWSDGLANKTFIVRDEACPGIPNNSCNTAAGLIHINPDSYNRKFLIGHELGHAIVHRWINYHPSASYSVNSGGSECTTEETSHALHSKEYQSAALTEGFAQFYATAIWNDESQGNGWFHYYKDYYKNGSVQDVNVENGPTGGVTAYMENECTGTFTGYGVELDWQRALWDYRTNPGTKPTHYQILRQYKNAVTGGSWSNTGAGDAFAAAIADYDNDHGTDFYPRWIEMSTYNGVDH